MARFVVSSDVVNPYKVIYHDEMPTDDGSGDKDQEYKDATDEYSGDVIKSKSPKLKPPEEAPIPGMENKRPQTQTILGSNNPPEEDPPPPPPGPTMEEPDDTPDPSQPPPPDAQSSDDKTTKDPLNQNPPTPSDDSDSEYDDDDFEDGGDIEGDDPDALPDPSRPSNRKSGDSSIDSNPDDTGFTYPTSFDDLEDTDSETGETGDIESEDAEPDPFDGMSDEEIRKAIENAQDDMSDDVKDTQQQIDQSKEDLASMKRVGNGMSGGGASGISLLSRASAEKFTNLMKPFDQWIRDLKGKAGQNLVYSTDTVSRRVKGLFGREIDSDSHKGKELDKVLAIVYDTSGSMNAKLMTKISSSLFYKLTREKIVKYILPIHFDGRLPTKFYRATEATPEIEKMLKNGSGSYIQPAYRQLEKLIRENKSKMKVSGIVIISDYDIFDAVKLPDDLYKELKDIPIFCLLVADRKLTPTNTSLATKYKNQSGLDSKMTFALFDGLNVKMFMRNGKVLS
ncbi:hypothetical protein EVB94_276 [Rhizobium phage RHph_TM40]|nr:hypothetical protein EVB94_276 [Rhizobium phage RHph_TM40]